MKLNLSPLLPLLLIACASEPYENESSGSAPSDRVAVRVPEEPASAVPKSEPDAPAAAEPIAAPAVPAEPVAAGEPAQPRATLGTTDKPVAAPVAAEPAVPPVPATPPDAAATNATKPAPFAMQLPTVPPTPCPVVPAPAGKVDSHALSGTNLGGPITVFGKKIDENQIIRHLCYGVGGKHIETMKFDILCRGEIAKFKAAGKDVSALVVTDADLEKAVNKLKKDFLLKYPTLDFATEVGRTYLSLDVYMTELRPALLFDKTFFPEDPANWPDVTTETVIKNGEGRGFIDDAYESYRTRKQMQIDQKLEDIPPDDPILTDTLRQWLLDELNQFATVESDPAKMPADTLLIVDGISIKVDEVWNVIRPYVTWENVDEARRFLAQLAAVEHDLTQRNALMTQEAFEQLLAPAPNSNYRQALTNYEVVALTIQGFPSIQSWIGYERLQRSYRNVIKDEIATDAQITPYLQRANQIAGAAKIDAEVLLCSAFDFPHARWAPNGWKTAEEKAKGLKQKLDAGADWGDLIELHSDFWDPPVPEVGHRPPFGFINKGRFGPQTRNQLVGDLFESEFKTFLRGRCAADEIFFEQAGGTISEIKPCPRGYVISRVNSRTPASAGLNLQQPQNREFLLNYVCSQRFGAYARQMLTDAIAKGEVSGL